MTNTCPVCGYPALESPPYYGGNPKEGPGSFEICPSCDFQFGYTDDDQGYTFAQWRQKWIDGGMVWRRGREAPPAGWNPQKQLLNIGVKV